MDNELDEKIVKDFPLLYADRHASMQSTCMCWGFPGNGWEPLIRDLSSKLEPLIQKIIGANPHGECMCGHAEKEHIDGKCTHMDRIPIYRMPWCRGYAIPKNKVKAFVQKQWYHLKWKVMGKISRLLSFLAEYTPLYKKRFCECQEFQVDHPRASQVKEKFGTLRFYMTCGTDEMYKLIDEAEKVSAKTCEVCGKPGKLRGGGWILCLCDECCLKQERPLEDDYEDEEDDSDGDKDGDAATSGSCLLDISFRPKMEEPPSGDTKDS